jgi:DNA-binding response OmpR family regulator
MNKLIHAGTKEGDDAIAVLVVDDVEANRAILCRRLEKFGFQYVAADSGLAALVLLRQAVPDIILLDYMMPQMNGLEVLRELRREPATREVPVIMVTARTEGDAVIEALEAGADDYVTKPIDFDVLRARMETQLDKRRNAHQLRRANAVLDERVTLRAMALADLQDELKEEIGRRKELEAEVEIIRKGGVSEDVDLVGLGMLLRGIERASGSLFAAVTGGRGANLAHLAEVCDLVGRAMR